MGQSITITSLREIPLNKLVPASVNVRQTAKESGIEELAASILGHGLLQSMTVRPQLDEDNRETGRFEVIAGGRRLAALKLLAGQKKLPKTAPIPCIVREDGSARELSLAENVLRVPLHPADQFEAFRQLNEGEGLGAEDIGARFGVTARVVRERLKLAAVSPRLLDRYRSEDLTLDQIMAFAVIDDHRRQEEVWESLAYDKSPAFIRRRLLQGHLPAGNKLAVFVGLDAYEAAGGNLLRDLFAPDDGGYLTDVALLERLASAKLEAAAEAIRPEGWKWVETAFDYPHAHGLRRVYPQEVTLPETDLQRIEQIEEELDQLDEACEATEEPDPGIVARGTALRAEYDALEARSRVYEPDDIARSGAIVSVDQDGTLAIVRGLVKPGDEPEEEEVPSEGDEASTVTSTDVEGEVETVSGLSDRLLAELSAERTMAIRDQLGIFPDMAHVAITHALALQLFLHGGRNASCLTIHATETNLAAFAPVIGEGLAMKSIVARHESWAARLPRDPESLWDFVHALAFNERQALLAHCVSLLVDGVKRAATERKPGADVLADAVRLDMCVYWRPGSDNYFSRVPKALILEAVREGVSVEASDRLRSLKKADMAKAAEELLALTSWLPAILRAPSVAEAVVEKSAAAE